MDSSRGQPPPLQQQQHQQQRGHQQQYPQAQHEEMSYSSLEDQHGHSQHRSPFHPPPHVYPSHSVSQVPPSPVFTGERSQSTAEAQVLWHRQQQQIPEEQMRRQQASAIFHQPNQQQQRQVFSMSRSSDHPQQHHQHTQSMQSPSAAQNPSRELNFWGQHSHASPGGTNVRRPEVISREPASPLPSLAQPFSSTLRSNDERVATRPALPQRQPSARPQSQSTSPPMAELRSQNNPLMSQGRTLRSLAVPSSLTSRSATNRSAPYPPPRPHRLPSVSSPSSPGLVRDELPQYVPGTSDPGHSFSQGQSNGAESVTRSRSHYPSTRRSHPARNGLRHQLVTGESTLPPRAPISVTCPQEEGNRDGSYDGQDEDVVMEEEDPLEVTLNIDLPKSTRTCEGEPGTTVLNINPSWHCVFIETIQQERIRCSLRIQFCGSSRRMEHRALVCQLQSLQVIGYQSRQVELTRRIIGKNLLNKGGIIVHLDPLAINYNDASYGFTISISSFSCDRLDCRYHRPDELLPLTRQQNSAFCRRNLKELYNDTSSKDVIVTLLPSQELFYVHSVVLENYGYFRELLEEQGKNVAGHARLRRQGSSRSGIGGFMTSLVGIGDVDEDGFAQPLDLNSFPATRLLQPSQQQPSQQQSPPAAAAAAAGPSASSLPSSSSQPPPSPPPPRPTRPRISLEIEGASPNVFRAILHFLYMGHIPTTGASCFRSSAPTSAVLLTATGARECSSPSSTPSAPATMEADSIPTPSSALPTVNPFDFAWTDLYDAAVRFQLVGLTRLARLVLVSRLEPDSAVQELMTWAYQHESLIPCYVSFIIESVHPDHFKEDKIARSNAQVNSYPEADRAGNSGGVSSSLLWDYREKCPKFGEILLMIVQMLDERRPVLTTL
ncbi:hypothetical protein EMPS_02927 [Entomortierella parvispora]|uniref:BTB domain-containing protein n=1 Tax=Entomortierella parvispora TaxID=205924 RepID=A0A9P3H5U1_9FUNG|nr:hypothetical protein EMPS_02927 [Entomortierella parvispora]